MFYPLFPEGWEAIRRSLVVFLWNSTQRIFSYLCATTFIFYWVLDSRSVERAEDPTIALLQEISQLNKIRKAISSQIFLYNGTNAAQRAFPCCHIIFKWVCCGRGEERHFRPKENMRKLKSWCDTAMSVIMQWVLWMSEDREKDKHIHEGRQRELDTFLVLRRITKG